MKNPYEKQNQLIQSEMDTILNNIDQGILLFCDDLKVKEPFSKKCLEFFKVSPKNKYIDELLFKNFEHEKKVFNKAFNMIKLNKDPSYVKMCLSILPKEIILNNKDVNLSYKFLLDNKFMITIEDISKRKKLEKKIHSQQQIQKMIVAIVSNKDEFLDLKNDFEKFCTNIEHKLNTQKDFEIFLRQLHTYKGLFSQKEMNYIVQTIHNLETKVKTIETLDNVNKKILINLVKNANLLKSFNNDLLNAIKILGEEYFDSIGRNFRINAIKSIEKRIKVLLENHIIVDSKILQNIFDDILTLNLVPLYNQFISYPSLINKTADALNKKIHHMKINGPKDLLVPMEFKNFTKTLLHVYRNCVDHGIEDPDTRVMFYKDEYGTIQTNFYKEENSLIIEIKDDGEGINISKIIQKAIDKNIFTQDDIKNMNDSEKLMLIFHDKISTKDKASLISGRGVGLSAVKDEVEKLNGKIKIINTPIYGASFKFILPLKNYSNPLEELDIIINQSIYYFKDSLFLKINSVNNIQEYSPSKDEIAVINFTDELNALCTLEADNRLLNYLYTILLPENFPNDEKSFMAPEILKEILNTFLGLSLNDIKKLGYKKVGIDVPIIINKTSYDKIVLNSKVSSFIQIKTDKGDFVCSFIKNI